MKEAWGERKLEKGEGKERGKRVTRTKWGVRAEGKLENKPIPCAGSQLPVRREKVKQKAKE